MSVVPEAVMLIATLREQNASMSDRETAARIKADELAGHSLSEVLNRYIFDDPEIQQLGKQAVAKLPAFERVLLHRCCYLHGVDAWPLGKDHELIGAVRPHSSRTSPVGWLSDPSPHEVLKAADAIATRYQEILRPLRDGEVIAHGINATIGNSERIPTSIWSHREFWLSPREFDVQKRFTDHPDRIFDLRDVWQAVTLEAGAAPASASGLPTKRKTADQASIDEAINALWPDGNYRGIPKQRRDGLIQDWQRQNMRKVSSSKTIKRHLG